MRGCGSWERGGAMGNNVTSAPTRFTRDARSCDTMWTTTCDDNYHYIIYRVDYLAGSSAPPDYTFEKRRHGPSFLNPSGTLR
ncbi:hypothetical protein PUN28_005219 [Cardiocondyla obscurior]|uniref:Uncharacterized protein n=1 Tax=Cardiocondyla obscurior TaxID=286306 RepID=A0AAW2GIR8_9HYME